MQYTCCACVEENAYTAYSPCGAAWWQWPFAWRTYSVLRGALSAPLRGAGNICLAGLYPTVRLCPPVSSCLSVLRSSVCFSLLLASHKRPPEGTATITREYKGGKEARGLTTTINERTRWRVRSLFLSFPSLFPLLSPFFASAWRFPPARGAGA